MNFSKMQNDSPDNIKKEIVFNMDKVVNPLPQSGNPLSQSRTYYISVFTLNSVSDILV